MKNNTLKLLNDAVYETLEGRQMMSATPASFLHNGVLNVNGNPTMGTRILINFAANNSKLAVSVEGQTQYFPTSQVKSFNITGGSGSDYIYIDPGIDIPASMNGGAGNDTLRGGGGNDTIIDGNGNDVIYGKGGNNYIQAGTGNDTLMGDRGNDTLIAGDGNDSIVGGGGVDNMTAGNGNDTFSAGDSGSTIHHGSGHDVLIGGLSNSYLYVKSGTGGSTTGGTSGSTGGSSGSSGKTSGGTTTGGTTSGGTTSGGTTTGGSTSGGTTSGKNSSGGTTTGGTTSGGTSSGGSTSGTTTGGSGTGTGGTTTPITATSTGAPVAVIKTLSGPRITGMVVNVDGLSSKVGTGTQITSNYAWDFGDVGTQYDQLTGFNAAHVYDKPGTYTITLTVTNDAGQVSKATQTVTIAAAARDQIYVDSVNGSDSNRGSANAPLQSLAAAFAQIGDNTEILLKAGDTFYTGSSLHVANTNVLIGRYGTGANPMIMRTIGNGLSTIGVSGNTDGLTIQDITFNSPYAVPTNGIANKIGVGGIFLAGSNCTVRDCTFLNIDDAINENGNPTGVLVQSNNAPLVTGVRGYFVWGQGAQDTIVGNFVANSTREHVVRCVGVDELTVEDNNFTNLNRQNVDTNDFSKGCIEVHVGENDWVVGNIVADGDIRVGPLGLWGEPSTDTTSNCVIEDNQLTNTFVFVQSGTRHAMIADNVINNTAGQAMVISGTDAEGESSADITIVHNTGVDTGTQGSFLELLGYVNGIVMNNNLWVAPSLKLGTYSAAPVRVTAGYMSDFTQITGNVWPSPVTYGTYANGGINLTGGGTLGNGYLTPAQWNALSNVGNDVFQNVTLNSSYQISVDSLTAGAAVKIAA